MELALLVPRPPYPDGYHGHLEYGAGLSVCS